MKAIDAGLQAHIDSGATTLALAWKVTRNDGVVLGFTDHDLDLEFDGVTFRAAAGFTASRFEQSLGLSVDNLNAVGALTSTAISEDDIARGLYDGAGIELHAVNWTASEQRTLLLAGSIGKVTRGRTAFEAEIRSLAHVLGQATGRSYQYYCDAVLGDGRCGIDLDTPALTGHGTATGSEGLAILASGIGAFAPGWFAGGRLTWTGGSNSGRATEVRAHEDGRLTLWAAPSDPVAPGDTFDVTAGCDKAFETCRTRFSNTVNFRGFPHMPGNDIVTSYPNRGDGKLNGGSLLK